MFRVQRPLHSYRQRVFTTTMDTAGYARENRAKVLKNLVALLGLSSGKDTKSPKADHHYLYLAGGDIVTRRWTDTEEKFRQESNFFYLTGLELPGYHVVISIPSGETTLLSPKYSADHALWCGPTLSLDGLKKQFGVEQAEYVDDIAKILKKGDVVMHVLEGTDLNLTEKIEGVKISYEFAREAITEARVVKTKHEIELMQRACSISSKAHIKLMKASIADLRNEKDLEALFIYECSRAGARFQAYTPIVATHRNPSILHYINNNADIVNDSCVLVDAGCEIHNYASDITRTWPAKGAFTKHWRDIYAVVLEANKQVIEELKPGIRWEDMHRKAEQIICKGLQRLELIVGSTEELLKNHIPALFFPHGLGHLLGLDVHDVGGYPKGVERIQEPGIRYLRMRRDLKEGMVLTVEPGIYFVDEILNKAFDDPKMEPFLNIPRIKEYTKLVGGVRIEDNVLITATGHKVLTAECPKEIAEIEKLTRSKE